MRVSGVREFLGDEAGAIAVDWVVISATIVAMALAVVAVASNGVESVSDDIVAEVSDDEIIFASQNFGRGYEAYLREADWQSRSGQQQVNLFNTLTDPERRSDAQLRNQHRNWSNRAADPSYSNPGQAADRVAVYELAMDVRGVEPHSGY
ncbi:MAG: hypothetical protein AAF689_12300 [Pseudomonadota bacterium]